MIKTLLALSGALLLAAPALHAQGHRSFAGRPTADRSALVRGRSFGRSYGYGGHRYGRYYYYGGIPYFFPFYDVGFGYPGYYGGFGYGDGFGYGGGYGYGGAGYGAAGAYPGGPYEGRIANEGSNADRGAGSPDSGPSLPQAVQRQLSKKGYYKGEVDGQFGPASRSALSRFQREHNLKETGRIDEPTLDALGFTDRAR